MVKHERDHSGSPVPGNRKKRRKDDSPSDHSPQRAHPQRDERHSHGRSHSPGGHTHKHKHHKHKDKRRERREQREEHHHDENEELKFDPHRRIKEEPTDGFREPRLHDEPQRRFKQEPSDIQGQREEHRGSQRHVKVEPTDTFRDQQRQRQRNDDRRREARQQREREDGGASFGGPSAGEEAGSSSTQEKEKPNFELSGKLTEDTNTYRGVVIKYNEPAEARKPKRRWRLYGFKGEEALPMLPIHRQSAYLLGRDRRVADIPIDHPSCSKQHAVLQYRLTDYTRPDGSHGRKVRPYIIDLGSANGTFVNNQQIEAQRYVELFERDLIKFGFSSREYVLLHENVDTSEIADQSDTDWGCVCGYFTICVETYVLL